MGPDRSEEAKVMMRGRLAGKPELARSMGGELVCRFTVVREVGPASCPVDLSFYVRASRASGETPIRSGPAGSPA